jgi:hypothetical protein
MKWRERHSEGEQQKDMFRLIFSLTIALVIGCSEGERNSEGEQETYMFHLIFSLTIAPVRG